MSSQSNFSHEDVVRILQIIDTTTDIDLSIEIDGLSLRVQKGAGQFKRVEEAEIPSGTAVKDIKPTPPEEAVVTAATEPLEAKAIVEQVEELPSTLAEGMVYVLSPMTGRFFRASSPLEPAYVEEGTRVEEDDPVCLLEIMKVYNTVSADVVGTVRKILVENGDMVEQDQPLFVIELEK